MEVIIREKNPKPFSDINKGDCFKYKNELFMKTENIIDYNVVGLQDGSLFYIDNNIIVDVCKTELHVW